MDYIQWIIIIITGLMVGFSKTGISGITMLIVPILASTFGGKESTGILLPMLLVGDVIAVWYYHRHADWSNIKRLLPWAFAGLVAGVAVGNLINDSQFKMLIAVFILICLVILIYIERKGEDFKVPEKTWFFALTGISAGLATMIGNVAGPIFSVYLLAKGLKKNDFIGTSAWFFFIINIIKLPLQIFFWHNVYLETFTRILAVIPAIALGAFFGIVIIKKINEKLFRYIVIGMTAIAAVRLFI